jgi:hypothetical protein
MAIFQNELNYIVSIFHFLIKTVVKMSDAEADPYAVSSDEDEAKGPPPKIEIEGRTTADFQQIVSVLFFAFIVVINRAGIFRTYAIFFLSCIRHETSRKQVFTVLRCLV